MSTSVENVIEKDWGTLDDTASAPAPGLGNTGGLDADSDGDDEPRRLVTLVAYTCDNPNEPDVAKQTRVEVSRVCGVDAAHAGVHSSLIRAVVDQAVSSGADAGVEIEVPLHATAHCVALVAEYVAYRRDEVAEIPAAPLTTRIMRNVLKDTRDAVFIDAVAEENKQCLYDLIPMGNYLDMAPLMHLAAAKMSTYIKGYPAARGKANLAETRPVPPVQEAIARVRAAVSVEAAAIAEAAAAAAAATAAAPKAKAMATATDDAEVEVEVEAAASSSSSSSSSSSAAAKRALDSASPGAAATAGDEPNDAEGPTKRRRVAASV